MSQTRPFLIGKYWLCYINFRQGSTRNFFCKKNNMWGICSSAYFRQNRRGNFPSHILDLGTFTLNFMFKHTALTDTFLTHLVKFWRSNLFIIENQLIGLTESLEGHFETWFGLAAYLVGISSTALLPRSKVVANSRECFTSTWQQTLLYATIKEWTS